MPRNTKPSHTRCQPPGPHQCFWPVTTRWSRRTSLAHVEHLAAPGTIRQGSRLVEAPSCVPETGVARSLSSLPAIGRPIAGPDAGLAGHDGRAVGARRIHLELVGREVRHPAELQLNEQESKILNAIQLEPTSIETVVATSGLPIHRVLSTISVLEMRKLVRRVSGSTVMRVTFRQ